MVSIPPEPEYTREQALADLRPWYELQEELRALQVREILLRKKIFEKLFPNPSEGANSLEIDEEDVEHIGLPAGTVVKSDYTFSYKVDDAALDGHKKAFAAAKIKTDELIDWKPELRLTPYRKLNAKQKKLFDEVIEAKPPGSPAKFEIKVPKP